MKGATAKIAVSGTGGDVELVASVDTTGLALVIGGGASDGFVGAALPAGKPISTNRSGLSPIPPRG